MVNTNKTNGRRLTPHRQKQDTSEMKPVNRAARRAMASNKVPKPTNKKWQRV